jgi:hypothetical protein
VSHQLLSEAKLFEHLECPSVHPRCAGSIRTFGKTIGQDEISAHHSEFHGERETGRPAPTIKTSFALGNISRLCKTIHREFIDAINLCWVVPNYRFDHM